MNNENNYEEQAKEIRKQLDHLSDLKDSLIEDLKNDLKPETLSRILDAINIECMKLEIQMLQLHQSNYEVLK